MPSALINAATKLTFLGRRDSFQTRPLSTLFYPILGLIPGLSSFLFVLFFNERLSALVAFSIAALWLLLAHPSLGRNTQLWLQTALGQGSEPTDFPALSFVVFLGKFVALFELARLDYYNLGWTVLLAPVIARFAAGLIELSFPPKHREEDLWSSQVLTAAIGACLVTGLLCLLAPALGFALVIFAIITAIAIRIVSLTHPELSSHTVMSATCELAELCTLCVPTVALSFGINLCLL